MWWQKNFRSPIGNQGFLIATPKSPPPREVMRRWRPPAAPRQGAEIMDNERMTGVLPARLTHLLHIIEANGGSYSLE